MNPIDLDSIIQSIVTLHGAKLVIVTCIGLGYLLKLIKKFPNTYIPHCVVLAGAPLAVLLMAWPSPASQEPGIRFIEAAAWTQASIGGLLLGAAGWLLHNKVLRKYLDEKLGNGNGEQPPVKNGNGKPEDAPTKT